jgi:hypothetical protein
VTSESVGPGLGANRPARPARPEFLIETASTKPDRRAPGAQHRDYLSGYIDLLSSAARPPPTGSDEAANARDVMLVVRRLM